MKKAVAILLGLGVVAGATHALAGRKLPNTVVINGNNFAGTPGDARASADTQQYIGCVIGGNSQGFTGFCAAKNSAGVTKTCAFNSTGGFGQAVASISALSNISVWYDAGGNCTTIQVDNSSYNRPTTP